MVQMQYHYSFFPAAERLEATQQNCASQGWTTAQPSWRVAWPGCPAACVVPYERQRLARAVHIARPSLEQRVHLSRVLGGCVIIAHEHLRLRVELRLRACEETDGVKAELRCVRRS